ncbi:MAG: glycosyltransferase family 9 protein [Deltaproteobacteria bacterium]|nr:glycosyltransferase family 9 protein [Deltaproteobacteria bacterium]
MRRIDYHVGIPVCFLLTAIVKLQRLFNFKSPQPREKPRNVLFIELVEMGSTVIAYPAMRELKRRYPDANLYFLLFKEIEETVELVEIIPKENVFTIRKKSAFSVVKDTLKFMRLCRIKKIDTVINLQMFVRYSSILSYLSGAKTRVGFFRYNQEGIYTGDLLTHRVIYNPHIHTVYSFMALVYALDAPVEQIPMVKFPLDGHEVRLPKITSTPAAKKRIWALLKALNPHIDETKTIVVVNPNASKLFPMRKWPLESYATLVKRLLEDKNICVIITGVQSEKPDAAFICEFVGDNRVLDLTGKTTLKNLLDLYNISKVLITNDSGPAHFASLTDIHVVVVFGPELPARYKPLTDNCTVIYANYACSPCVGPYNQRLTPCNDNLCLKAIGVERVYPTLKAILNNEKTGA